MRFKKPTTKKQKREWDRVVFVGDCGVCPCCEEPWCIKCEDHYSDCACIGPTEENTKYKTEHGILYGKRQ